MSLSGRGRHGGKRDPLSKKIPDNPRYAHVKHVVDSGSSVTSYLRHLDEIKQNYRYRKDEIFKRLKATTFAQLILQIELYDDQEVPPADGVTPEPTDQELPDTPRSTLSSVIHGMGEMDFKQPSSPNEASKSKGPPPYLLLDVRDREDYDKSHIITAKHYPPSMLARTCNYFTQDILNYKNKSDCIIIVYDEDERVAPRVVTTFIQREIDNVFMLSGGMKVLYKLFPEGMITGQIPLTLLASPPNSSRSSRPGKRTQQQQPLPSSARGQSATAVSADLRDKFTEEDLAKIQSHLDTALLSTSRESSRASSRTGTSDSVYPVSSSNNSRACTTPGCSNNPSTRASAIPWK